MNETMLLHFSQAPETGECPLMYVEVPENQVGPGDDVEIRLWGPAERLQGWALCIFGQSLGTGELCTVANAGHTEQVDLAESLEAQLEYPVMRFTRVAALTPLACIDDEEPYPPKIWRQPGRVLTRHCSRKGHSCLQVNHERPLYGSLEVSYQRVPSYLAWFWTIPEDYYGDVWFFLYDDVSLEPYRKFAVELPERVSVEEGVRNVSIKTVDFTTEAAIAGASIYLDGKLQGATDAQGVLHLTDVPTGTHDFKAVCPGYLDTDQDSLSNERIVVK